MTRPGSPGVTPALVSHRIGDSQAEVAPFDIAVPGLGRARVIHGMSACVGTIRADGVERIALLTARAGCGCGCGAAGRAMLFTPTVDDARAIAAQLNEQADQLERAAAAEADAVLRRAGAGSATAIADPHPMSALVDAPLGAAAIAAARRADAWIARYAPALFALTLFWMVSRIAAAAWAGRL